MMRKQIYSEIRDLILSIQDSEIKHFDLWNQQTEVAGQGTPFQYPAVFLEFAPAKWRSMGTGIQETDLTVRLHIVTEYDAGQTPDFFDIVDCVTAVMHDSVALESGRRWTRSQSITDHSHKCCIDNIEEYVCNLQEIPAPPGKMVQVTIQPNAVSIITE